MQALRLKWPSWADLELTIWELLWRRRKRGRPDLTHYYPFSLVTPGFNHSGLWDLKCVSTAICACMCRQTSRHLGQQLNHPPELPKWPHHNFLFVMECACNLFSFPFRKKQTGRFLSFCKAKLNVGSGFIFRKQRRAINMLNLPSAKKRRIANFPESKSI